MFDIYGNDGNSTEQIGLNTSLLPSRTREMINIGDKQKSVETWYFI